MSDNPGNNQCPVCTENFSSGQVWDVPDFEFRLGPARQYFRCSGCRSIYQWPLPTEQELDKWYPDNYFSGKNGKGLRKKLQQLLYLKRKRIIDQCEPENTNTKKVLLDYGSGDGEFINYLKVKDTNIEPAGFDKFGKNYGNINVQIDVKSSLVENSADIVTMHHVIEHLISPKPEIKEIYNTLKPSGWLIGETPNAESLELDIFGTFWAGFHAPRHTVIFSEGSLISFLQEAGFRNIQVWAGHNPAQAAISLASVINIDEPRFRSMWLLPLAIIINIVESIFNNSGVLRFKAQKTV